MHADLLQRAQIARENIDVPTFPLASIRSAVAHAPKPTQHRRTIIASILAGLSIVAIATAAEVLQTRITFTPKGAMVISSNEMSPPQLNPTEADILNAASRLDFAATLPSGLPVGTTATQMNHEGSSALYIRYDLPGAERRSHHLMWIFLANPTTISGHGPSETYGKRVNQVQFGGNQDGQFRAGSEQVIIVSNGLTSAEFAAIKASMVRAAQDGR